MATVFPLFAPSTFPMISLGPPASITNRNPNVSTTSNITPPPPADIPAVLTAIHHCSAPDASIRRPAEELLQQWENHSGVFATGYLISLISIIDSSSEPKVDENTQLMGAILLKNGIPKVFGVTLPDAENEQFDVTTLQQLQ